VTDTSKNLKPKSLVVTIAPDEYTFTVSYMCNYYQEKSWEESIVC